MSGRSRQLVDQPRRRVAPPTLCSLESITKSGPLKKPLKKKVVKSGKRAVQTETDSQRDADAEGLKQRPSNKKTKKMGKGAMQTETDSQRDADAEGSKQSEGIEVSFNETIVILNKTVEEEEVIVNDEGVIVNEVDPEEEVVIQDNVARGINEAARTLPVVQKNRCKHLDHLKSKCPALLEKYGERNADGELVLPDRVDQNGRAFWIIEKILEKEFGEDGLPVRALVQWQGFSSDEAQWEPASIFADAPSVLYDEGVKDGITDAVIHLGGFARNEKVERIITNLASANPDVQIGKIFPNLAKLGNKDNMTQQQKQNLRKKLQKLQKAAEKRGLNIPFL
uniref:Chromo domain-containing protein n=1 Tax=Meloidogyne javanica TaxID=6303 RepID=A0A915LM85_MELJA